jgi:putative membrane protein
MKLLVAVATMMSVCALVAACSLVERAMPGATMSDADLLGVWHTINHSEINTGQLARDRASSEEVLAYASRMVHDHQMYMQDADRLTHRIGMEPHKPALASTFENAHQKAMEELRDSVGQNFDESYIGYQITLHQQAINLVNDAVGWVNDQQVKRFLGETVPDLQSHLEAAQSIQRRILNR